jgi:hypothetical protein
VEHAVAVADCDRLPVPQLVPLPDRDGERVEDRQRLGEVLPLADPVVVDENDVLDKSDIFECTAPGKDLDGNIGVFVEGQILKADGLKVKDLKIVEILSKTRFRLSTSVLLNSREVPGNNYCAETPPTLVKRYNVLSFRAAKIAYDEDKRTGGLKEKDKAG